MNVVSFGGGTNSTAMLIEMRDRGIVPDLILFADTGGERPYTYAHIDDMQKWLIANQFPEITIVKKVDFNGDILTLEDDCLRKKMLPSVAYGFKTCSQKYKAQPQEKYLNNHPQSVAAWKAGAKVTKWIGFDAGEPHRAAKDYTCNKYEYKYPLIEWGIDREKCVAIIRNEGLPAPHKSSCFFCPNSRPSEIREMAALHPELMERAIRMESNAELTRIKGLGRGHFAWRDVIATSEMFPFVDREQPCGCYDG